MAKSKPQPKARAGVRVIALESFDDHPYGHEFELPRGAKLDKMIADRKVRIDDRMTAGRVPTEGQAPAEGETR